LKELIVILRNTINSGSSEYIKLITKKLHVKSFQLPIINFDLFKDGYKNEKSLRLEFVDIKENLVNAIKESSI
jgi:hypothetical protein